MKRLIIIVFLFLSIGSIAQTWNTGMTKPTGTTSLQTPYNVTWHIHKGDTILGANISGMGWYPLFSAKKVRQIIDSLAYHVNDTLAFYRLKSDHDSLSQLDERSYNSLTDKPNLALYRLLTNHDSLSQLDEKDYNSLTNKPNLNVYRTLSNHDSLSTLQERSYNSLTELPNLSVYRMLTNHDSLATLQEKSYNSLDDKPNLSVYLQASDIAGKKNISDSVNADGYTRRDRLASELAKKVTKNTDITGATKTKITYDSKGLVTSGADATTADIASSTDRRYVTEDEKANLHTNHSNRAALDLVSGTNTGDNATNTTSNAYADAKVEDQIVNGITTKAPSQNAVFDELALKENNLTKGNLTAASNKVAVTGGTNAVIGAGATVDVNETNLTLSNLSGAVTDVQVPNTVTLDNITQITNRSHTNLTDIGTYAHTAIDSHINNLNDPHDVTKAQVGLSEVDNTSDVNKPVSTLQQAALNTKVDKETGKSLVLDTEIAKIHAAGSDNQDLSVLDNVISLSGDATGVDISQTPAMLANTAKVTNATHTGDATGATELTLATVNSNVGTYNNVTINAKGLATGGSNVDYARKDLAQTITGAWDYTTNPTVNGNGVWHSGNFNPDSKLDYRTFGSAANSNTGDFIHNQNSWAQGADMWISGSGTFESGIYSSVWLGNSSWNGSTGRLYNDAALGLTIVGKTGATNDFSLANPEGQILLRIPTGTKNLVFPNAEGTTTISNLSGAGTRLVTASASGLLGSTPTSDFAPASGSGNYVQVSPASAQSGNIWMNGAITSASLASPSTKLVTASTTGQLGTTTLADMGIQPTITGLTTNYLPKWNGTGFSNSLVSDNGSSVNVSSTTPSTSTTTGALTIAGGLGVGGSGYFGGSVTASSFIKTGGTANQFLKANGSVDETAYFHNGNHSHRSDVQNDSRYAGYVSDVTDIHAINGSNQYTFFSSAAYPVNGPTSAAWVQGIQFPKAGNNDYREVIASANENLYYSTSGGGVWNSWRTIWDSGNHSHRTDAQNDATYQPLVTGLTNNRTVKWNNGFTDGLLRDNGTSLYTGTDTPNGLLNIVSGYTDFRISEGASNLTPTFTAINTSAGGKAVALMAGTVGSAFAFDEAGVFKILSFPKDDFIYNSLSVGTEHMNIDASTGVVTFKGLAGVGNRLITTNANGDISATLADSYFALSGHDHTGVYKPFDYTPDWDEILNKPSFGTSVFHNDGDYIHNQNNSAQTANAWLSGDMKANSFIKTGGTSSQFLKADGSVDENTYSTSAHNHTGTYEVPLTFSTGLNRTGNTITSTITQYTDAMADARVVAGITGKVDKVEGKGLSTEDYTTTEKTKLSGIASGAEVNVNADWNAVSGDAQILNKPTLFDGVYASLTGKPTLFSGSYTDLTNKPTIPTNNNQLTNGAGYITGYTETDPIYSAWNKSTGISITKSQVSDFPTSLSQFTNNLGNYGGFLTSEVDGSTTNEAQAISNSAGSNPTITLSSANGSGGGSFQLVGAGLTSVSASGNSIVISSTSGGMVYPSAGIPVSTGTGWGTSIPNNSSNWNTAYSNMGKVYFGGYGPLPLNYDYFDSPGDSYIRPRFGSVAEDEFLPVTGNDVWVVTANKQNQLSGTGFIKASGTTISYDNNSYALLNGSLAQAFNASSLTIDAGTDWVISNSGSGLNFNQYSTNIYMSSSGITAYDFIRNSDERIKHNIKTLDSLDWVNGIKWVQYEMNNDSTNRTKYGVVAQQVEEVNPALVYTNDKGEKSVAYIDLLVATVAQMQKEIAMLKKEVETLKNTK